MKFPSCKIKSIQLPLNEENMATIEKLKLYADKDAVHVEFVITPQQLPMFDKPVLMRNGEDIDENT